MKLKKYGKGGKYEMYEKGGKRPPFVSTKKKMVGPPKPPGYKEMSKEEREQEKNAKLYTKFRAELDRELGEMKRKGASQSAMDSYADRYLDKWDSYRKGNVSSYKYGGKMKKYLKGGQAKLDANNDGKISGADFKMLRAKKKK